MTALPSRQYSGQGTAIEEQGDHGMPGKGIMSKKCGQWYSWRKMKTAAQDRVGWSQVVRGLCFTRTLRHTYKSIKSSHMYAI